MGRIFPSRGQVQNWFTVNHPLDEELIRRTLDSAEEHPGEWVRLTTRFSVRLFEGVWEIDGIRLDK